MLNLSPILSETPITASAPCRVDMGGTLDIRTFYHPLSYLKPCTVNLALDLRTEVRLLPFREGHVKVSSLGFEEASFPLDEVPFRHPLGLIFAIAYYFRAAGVHIDIRSASPPRSSLGGSSAMAVALIAALSRTLQEDHAAVSLDTTRIALLAHAIEESTAGVLCGMQDHLAAAFGGIHRWEWAAGNVPFIRNELLPKQALPDINPHLLVAYCGVPHESKDINGVWIEQFLQGGTRAHWIEVAACSRRFATALETWHLAAAVTEMNREMSIRKEMTPEVLDDLGDLLFSAALEKGCGARITGAGAGGCMWALGETGAISSLRKDWERILGNRPDAGLLDAAIDARGVVTEL